MYVLTEVYISGRPWPTAKIVQFKTRELCKSIRFRASWNTPVMQPIEAVRELEYWRTNASIMYSTGQYVFFSNLDSKILI